ncbi:LuxR C-terminal-related transcriptional regulator [Chloroflexota bacterium]
MRLDKLTTEYQQSLPFNQEERLVATRIAKEKANVAKWGLNSVIALFAILLVVIILIARGTDTNLVGGLAALGLISVWGFGWRRGKQLFTRFYEEEISNLQSETTEGSASLGPLSNRERQVLHYAAQGCSNKQIGSELSITESTVKHFISSSMTKL